MKFLRYTKLLLTLFKLRLSRQMIYSFSFWSAFFVDTTVFLIQLAVFQTIFLQLDSLNGWNRYQMIFFVGTFTILDSLYMCTYFFGVISIPEKIRTGKLDLYITRPVNTLFFVSFESINCGSLLLTVPGFMMVAYAVQKLSITIGLMKVMGYVFLLGLMLILMYDLMIMIRAVAFWVTKIDSLQEFENEIVNFSFRVPGIVFKGVSKLFFYVILPYGLMATIPTQFFTGQFHMQNMIFVIAVVAVFTFISQVIWRQGLKNYGSASS